MENIYVTGYLPCSSFTEYSFKFFKVCSFICFIQIIIGFPKWIYHLQSLPKFSVETVETRVGQSFPFFIPSAKVNRMRD